jgi:hypothetical protein
MRLSLDKHVFVATRSFQMNQFTSYCCKNKPPPASCCFILVLFFGPEDGSEFFLRNVKWFSAECTALYPRSRNPSLSSQWVLRTLHSTTLSNIVISSLQNLRNTRFTQFTFTLRRRFTANQFVLTPSPLRPYDQTFVFRLNYCVNSPYVTSSLTRWRVCVLGIGLALFKCTYRTYSMLLKILHFA